MALHSFVDKLNPPEKQTVKEGYESAEPPKSDKPWYEDRWYEKPLDLQFRKFDDDKVEAGQGPGERVCSSVYSTLTRIHLEQKSSR
jgi:hypothetical protein